MALEKAPKAYKDEKFLNSPAARSLRIVSEYMEPQYRFRKENVRDTIVFYGSARLLSKSAANKKLKALKQLKNPKPQRIKDAEMDLEMSRYYDCLLYTSPSPRDRTRSRMPSSA